MNTLAGDARFHIQSLLVQAQTEIGHDERRNTRRATNAHALVVNEVALLASRGLRLVFTLDRTDQMRD